MSGPYQGLVDRIRGEVSDLGSVIERAMRGWASAQTDQAAQYAYLDSVALNLHGFYSGLERLFELIARQVDGSVPDSETWHRDLLQQMVQDRPDLRPAVISPDNAYAIDEFRRFRHLVRNVYTTSLEPEKMGSLMIVLPKLWPDLKAELLAFADYLDALNQSLQDPK